MNLHSNSSNHQMHTVEYRFKKTQTSVWCIDDTVYYSRESALIRAFRAKATKLGTVKGSMKIDGENVVAYNEKTTNFNIFWATICGMPVITLLCFLLPVTLGIWQILLPALLLVMTPIIIDQLLALRYKHRYAHQLTTLLDEQYEVKQMNVNQRDFIRWALSTANRIAIQRNLVERRKECAHKLQVLQMEYKEEMSELREQSHKLYAHEKRYVLKQYVRKDIQLREEFGCLASDEYDDRIFKNDIILNDGMSASSDLSYQVRRFIDLQSKTQIVNPPVQHPSLVRHDLVEQTIDAYGEKYASLIFNRINDDAKLRGIKELLELKSSDGSHSEDEREIIERAEDYILECVQGARTSAKEARSDDRRKQQEKEERERIDAADMKHAAFEAISEIVLPKED